MIDEHEIIQHVFQIDGPTQLRQATVRVKCEVHIRRFWLMKIQIATAYLFFSIGTQILGCDLDWDISTEVK